MTKPPEMGIGKMASAITQMNSKLIWFAGATEEDLFLASDLFEVFEQTFPPTGSWRAKFDTNHYVPAEHSKPMHIAKGEMIKRSEGIGTLNAMPLPNPIPRARHLVALSDSINLPRAIINFVLKSLALPWWVYTRSLLNPCILVENCNNWSADLWNNIGTTCDSMDVKDLVAVKWCNNHSMILTSSSVLPPLAPRLTKAPLLARNDFALDALYVMRQAANWQYIWPPDSTLSPIVGADWAAWDWQGGRLADVVVVGGFVDDECRRWISPGRRHWVAIVPYAGASVNNDWGWLLWAKGMRSL